VRATALSTLGSDSARSEGEVSESSSAPANDAASPETCWVLSRGRKQFPIVGPVCVVGRGDDANLQLNDLGVSRRHAVLRVEGTQLFIEDLGSRNGTFLRGQPVDGSTALASGDELHFGPCELRVGVFKRRPGEFTTLPVPRSLLGRSEQESPLESLSPRERELLPLLASGHSQRELAAQLGVTVKTIETYRTRIGHKLGLTSRAGLIRFALDHGLLGATNSLNEL
jgi:DNA-binding CsgD family transcriptional regulator